MNHSEQIEQAIAILKIGGLVAFPTETVYGLGADATNAAAVRKIYEAKGRSAGNPCIVHVADAKSARRYVSDWPAIADKLASAFWPGPLTFVLPKSKSIVDDATAGRATVALRSPDHPLAMELLRNFDGAIAAPSANRSMRISPTTAEHVRRDLGDRIDLILDGGPCRVGIESTVLDLTGKRPAILRPGSIRRSQIESILGPVEQIESHLSPAQTAASPGQQAVHYAPRTAAYRFEPSDLPRVTEFCRHNKSVILIPTNSHALATLRPIAAILQMPENPLEYAQKLYAALHEADQQGLAAIWIELPPDQPDWHALRDRIRRATKPIPPQFSQAD
jgi:L-threonylcarbamoyladenylate synthase